MPALDGVAGTTGYEWLNVISRVLVDDRGLERLETLRPEFTGNPREFAEILERAKVRVLENLLASEFIVLTRLLARIAAGQYSTRDFAIDRLRLALQEYIVCFPVYRTYVRAGGASGSDRATILTAIAKARARWVGTDTEIFDFLQDAHHPRPDRAGPQRLQPFARHPLCAEAAAADRADDGEVAGGHRLLPPHPAAGAERSRRRSRRDGARHRPISSPHAGARGSFAARHDRDRHA